MNATTTNQDADFVVSSDEVEDLRTLIDYGPIPDEYHGFFLLQYLMNRRSGQAHTETMADLKALDYPVTC